MNLFTSAALRLTLWYLALIMGVSIACTVALYQVSAGDLRKAVQRQIEFYSQVLAPEELQSFSKLRRAQLSNDLTHLRERLVLFNVVILVGGGLASYALARKTMRPLEESLKAQTRFTGDASHELRTPLSVMQTEIEVALRDPKLKISDAKELLASNLEEVNRLKALSEGLLRLAGTSPELKMERVALKKVVDEAMERSKKPAASRKIKLIKAEANGQVMGSPSQLADLVVILLDNAIKYSAEGQPVEISAGVKGGQGYIKIIDRGPGISAEDLPKIFDRFYRADSSRSKGQAEGYGLGLAIAKKIADLHHGYIEVKSHLDRGSTFTVKLPAAKPTKSAKRR